MSNAINSTHQQDRAAQQKLVNARHQASTQGQQQGAAFSRMLSLACDEDTDLDAMQLGGKLFDLKAGKGLAKGKDDDTTDGLPPTAQANATLLALLAQAQSAAVPTDAESQPETGSLAESKKRLSASTDTPETLSTDTAADNGLVNKAVPGKAVRDLARQLGDAVRNAATGQDSTGPNGVAWGRQVPVDAGTTPNAPAALAAGLEATAGGASAQTTGHSALPVATQAHAAGDSDDKLTGVEGDEAAPGQANSLELRTASNEGQSHGGLGGDALGGTEMGEQRSPNAEEVSHSAEQWREQWADAMDQVGQQVSYWVGQGGVRQATLRVGNGWQQSMDVKLSMKNGQAEIEFLTDHEAARSAIAEGGTEVLRGLLAQSGIDLGQVSIGTQTSGGDGDHPQGQANKQRSTRTIGEAPDAPPTLLQPRHAHSTGLDLYV